MELRPRLRHARHALEPWSGSIGGGLGWALSHQLGSDLVTDKCGAAHPLLMILIGIIGLAIAGFGGWISWRVRPREAAGRLFVATIGVMFAALFAIAIFMQTAATLFLPRCFG